jgi:hypothetical protein
MVRDYPASEQPVWRLVAQEAAAFAAAGLLLPFGLRGTRAHTPRRRDQRTIVLVHGYMANRSTLLPLAAYLRMLGLGPVLIRLPLGRRRGGGRDPAARLAAAARARRSTSSATAWAGSWRGPTCRSSAARAASTAASRSARRTAAPTTPTGCGRAWAATAPDSALLARLDASRGAAEGVHFVSIVAGSDNLVLPRVFAAHEEEVVVSDLGHLAMLFSPTVLKHVADELRRPAERGA